ncbi:MAG: hypothetical protein ABIF04_04705 [Chloroflexota bacterium]
MVVSGKTPNSKMKPKYLWLLCLITLVEGISVQVVLWGMTFDPGRGNILNYATLRLILSGVIALTLIALTVFMIGLFRKIGWGSRLSALLDKQLTGTKKRLFFIQGVLLILAFFLGECFLMTYLAFPVPMRPVFLWAALICLQVWLVLRIAYAGLYRQRPSLVARMRTKWTEARPVQRKVFIVVAILGLLYFAAFIPVNLLRDQYGNFFVHGDEKVVYPEVTNALISQNSFSREVHALIESWGWQYGYPYFSASALVLAIPRLIFGNQFIDHVQLNIFLLRQFISVLPMVLSLLLAVYLITDYKSMAKSVGIFIFLALVPGILKNNVRFWHPDSLIVLTVVLTIYFLKKDNLRFGRNFYLAAVFCGLAAAIKLWGLFFGLAIAGYLLAGLIQKKLTFGKMILYGLLFMLAMFGAIILSSPSLMAPYIGRVALRGWLPRQGFLLHGYDPGNDLDAYAFYETGLANWLEYFGYHFMKGYFFCFSFIALFIGSLWGAKVRLNRILLGWCTVTAAFLIYFVALKNFQYMLPLAVPLYCGAFLFPAITVDENALPKRLSFLAKPPANKIIWGVTITMVASQLIINLVILYLYALRGR